ncbi:MAG: asparagine synthase-related protein [Candidatus Omnitrophota bacterium]
MFILSINKELRLEIPSFAEEKFDFRETRVNLYFKQNGFIFDKLQDYYTLQESISNLKVRFIRRRGLITIECDTKFFKPVYYHITSGGQFLCASHISLLEQAGIKLEENLDALPEYFLYRCVAPPRTLYKSINLLGFAERLVISSRKQKLSFKKEYLTNLSIGNTYQQNGSVGLILERLTKTISELKEQRSEVTTLFSGGLDSSLLVSLAGNLLNQKKTFSTDYPREFDHQMTETNYAKSTSEYLKTDHTTYQFSKKEYFLGLIEAIASAEAPVHHLQSVCLYNLFKHGISPDAKILLCGQGADALCGMDGFSNTYRLMSSVWKNIPFKPILKKLFIYLYQRSKKGYTPAQYFENCVYTDGDIDFNFWSIGAYGNLAWIQREFGISKRRLLEPRINLLKTVANKNILDFMVIATLITNAAATQVIWGRLAESCGKYLFFPFSDLEVIKLSLLVSWEHKLKSKKYLIRKMCEDIGIPQDIINREKSSFGFEVSKWGGNHGLLVQLIDRFASGPLKDSLNVDLFDLKKEKDAMTLWSLLNYYIWHRIFIEKQSVEDLGNMMDEVLN